jgi:hypothetical protein
MIAIFPFVVQGVVMTVDEFYCHRRRELRRWERIGHPLDTLTYLLCFLFLLFVEPSSAALGAYVALSGFSCLFITKDEWQHRELCTPFENWLHALLYILHPIVLIAAGWAWWSHLEDLRFAVGAMAAITASFGIFQAAYWNFQK